MYYNSTTYYSEILTSKYKVTVHKFKEKGVIKLPHLIWK